MQNLVLSPELVVTRHAGLVEFARSRGLRSDVPIIPHASPEDVAGRVVLGVLPLRLAVHARAVIEADLEIRPEDRGRELSAEEVADRFLSWKIFCVRSLDEIVSVFEGLYTGDRDSRARGIRSLRYLTLQTI